MMNLMTNLLGLGGHLGGWRHKDAWSDNVMNLDHAIQTAQTAERGLFDLLFLADGNAVRQMDKPALFAANSPSDRPAVFEPVTLMTAVAQFTKYIGLLSTATTTYDQPYSLARRYASLDHLSKGRACWNIVTTSYPDDSLNFSRTEHVAKDERYERANEFVDVVSGLWDCWQDGAIVADKASGRFIDAERVRPLNHKGRFFKVRGPLNMARCPQGHPVIIQAGGSPSGLELAARTADVVFSVVQELAPAKAAYADLKGRMEKYGRHPDALAVLPGVMPIVGDSDAEARETLAKLQNWITPTNAATLVASRIGYDVSGHPLDGPVPPPPAALNSQTFPAVLYEMARRENMTLRDLYNLTAAARGHWVICGTPRRIADTLEEWFSEGAADGFNILPAWFPGAFGDFVDRVVPELQRRELFRREYGGATLRDHFGLPRVEA